MEEKEVKEVEEEEEKDEGPFQCVVFSCFPWMASVLIYEQSNRIHLTALVYASSCCQSQNNGS